MTRYWNGKTMGMIRRHKGRFLRLLVALSLVPSGSWASTRGQNIGTERSARRIQTVVHRSASPAVSQGLRSKTSVRSKAQIRKRPSAMKISRTAVRKTVSSAAKVSRTTHRTARLNAPKAAPSAVLNTPYVQGGSSLSVQPSGYVGGGGVAQPYANFYPAGYNAYAPAPMAPMTPPPANDSFFSNKKLLIPLAIMAIPVMALLLPKLFGGGGGSGGGGGGSFDPLVDSDVGAPPPAPSYDPPAPPPVASEPAPLPAPEAVPPVASATSKASPKGTPGIDSPLLSEPHGTPASSVSAAAVPATTPATTPAPVPATVPATPAPAAEPAASKDSRKIAEAAPADKKSSETETAQVASKPAPKKPAGRVCARSFKEFNQDLKDHLSGLLQGHDLVPGKTITWPLQGQSAPFVLRVNGNRLEIFYQSWIPVQQICSDGKITELKFIYQMFGNNDVLVRVYKKNGRYVSDTFANGSPYAMGVAVGKPTSNSRQTVGRRSTGRS